MLATILTNFARTFSAWACDVVLATLEIEERFSQLLAWRLADSHLDILLDLVEVRQ